MSLLSSGWLRDSATWGAAGAVALSLHVGGAVWLLQKAEAAQIAGLPDPVYVELAPMPQAAAPLERNGAPGRIGTAQPARTR